MGIDTYSKVYGYRCNDKKEARKIGNFFIKKNHNIPQGDCSRQYDHLKSISSVFQ